MNRTAIALGILGVTAIMFTGVIVVALFRPDATATVIAFVGSTLGTLVSMSVLLYGLNSVNKKVDHIEKNTNGINTALLTQITGHGEDTINRMKNHQP